MVFYEKSPIFSHFPQVKHGFFGKEGGVSAGPFASLNASYGVGDQPSCVDQNRLRISQSLGGERCPIITVNQVHGADVCCFDHEDQQDSLMHAPPQADGLVTCIPNVFLGIVTADCGPLLWVDPERHIIGACHAGWRGALRGILKRTLDAMVSLGARKENLYVALGPMIQQESYEVDSEFRAQFCDQDPSFSLFFKNQREKYLFDLSGLLVRLLKNLGIDNVCVSSRNTFGDSFFSYRRACIQGQGVCGRQLSLIQLCQSPEL